MKAPILFGLITLQMYGTADAQEAVLLSPEKLSVLREERNRYEAEHEQLRTNWIAPLNLEGDYSYDKSALGSGGATAKVSASISQDIYRSGGITYQIRYADARKTASEIEWERQTAQLNEELFDALLSYRKSRFELEQSEKKLANHDIEIFIKRQLYEAGKADITELNNALMEKSGEQKNHAALRYALANQRLEIAKRSDIDPEVYVLPVFVPVQEEAYAQSRFDVRYARAQSETYENLYGVTLSGYLPSVALKGNAGYQEYDPQRGVSGYQGVFYSAGVSLSFPLAYNASSAIQEAKATYLKQAADASDKERGAKASYAQSLELIENYRRTIGIATNNLALYDELIAVIQAGVDAGSKTGYDLQTLKNTKAIEEYTVRINEINIQRELAKLHFSTRKELP